MLDAKESHTKRTETDLSYKVNTVRSCNSQNLDFTNLRLMI